MHVRNVLFSDSTTALILSVFHVLQLLNCPLPASKLLSLYLIISSIFKAGLHCHMHNLHFLLYVPILKNSGFGRSALIRQNSSSRKSLHVKEKLCSLSSLRLIWIWKQMLEFKNTLILQVKTGIIGVVPWSVTWWINHATAIRTKALIIHLLLEEYPCAQRSEGPSVG